MVRAPSGPKRPPKADPHLKPKWPHDVAHIRDGDGDGEGDGDGDEGVMKRAAGGTEIDADARTECGDCKLGERATTHSECISTKTRAITNASLLAQKKIANVSLRQLKQRMHR